MNGQESASILSGCRWHDMCGDELSGCSVSNLLNKEKLGKAVTKVWEIGEIHLGTLLEDIVHV